MPRGRRPQGDSALSNAERQARHRARQLSPQPTAASSHRPSTDNRSRSQRWNDTVAALLALQAEYTAWYDALPDNLRDSATADALQEIIDLDLETLAIISPPRGYGRD